MDSLLATITALGVSVAITPLMILLAPSLRMLDQPNARKVHVSPVPRVGGWGITLGALVSILLWTPVDPLTVTFTIGAIILLLGGAVDDSRDLPPSTKLLLQIAAAVPVALYAGLLINTIPLFGSFDLPLIVAVPLTVISLVACINATNTSDGLDGLAAGVTLLSFAGVLYLAFINENTSLLLITAAAMGGLAGFLRYNTHPAAIFMGDSGSQFLGFAVGFLGLALLHPDSAGLMPWTLLLLVGLPLADLVVVATRRLLRGVSCFKADKTHIHHRFLDIGVTHNQSVILIYVIQASFVFFAIALQSTAAWKILLAYGLHLAVIYGFLFLAEQLYRSRLSTPPPAHRQPVNAAAINPLLVWAPRLILEMLVPLILLLCAALATNVPTDFGILAGLLIIPLAIVLLQQSTTHSLLTRLPVFVLIAAVLYLYTEHRPFVSTVSRLTEAAGFIAVALVTAMALKFSPMRRRHEFRTNAMDYLLVIVALLTFFAIQNTPVFFNPYFLIYLPVLLYGCEVILVERRERKNWLLLVTLATAVLLLIRGVFL